MGRMDNSVDKYTHIRSGLHKVKGKQMKYLIIHNEKGQIESLSSGEFPVLPPNSVFVETDLDVVTITTEYAIYNSQLHPIGKRPGTWYRVDNTPPEWVKDTELEISVMTNTETEKRNQLLKDSDWTQLPDVVLPNKEAWKTYRQQLRDITERENFPLNVVWPTQPKEN